MALLNSAVKLKEVRIRFGRASSTFKEVTVGTPFKCTAFAAPRPSLTGRSQIEEDLDEAVVEVVASKLLVFDAPALTVAVPVVDVIAAGGALRRTARCDECAVEVDAELAPLVMEVIDSISGLTPQRRLKHLAQVSKSVAPLTPLKANSKRCPPPRSRPARPPSPLLKPCARSFASPSCKPYSATAKVRRKILFLNLFETLTAHHASSSR